MQELWHSKPLHQSLSELQLTSKKLPQLDTKSQTGGGDSLQHTTWVIGQNLAPKRCDDSKSCHPWTSHSQQTFQMETRKFPLPTHYRYHRLGWRWWLCPFQAAALQITPHKQVDCSSWHWVPELTDECSTTIPPRSKKVLTNTHKNEHESHQPEFCLHTEGDIIAYVRSKQSRDPHQDHLTLLCPNKLLLIKGCLHWPGFHLQGLPTNWRSSCPSQ